MVALGGNGPLRVDDRLRSDLAAAVRRVEESSAAEVVVTVVPRSAGHWDVALAAALAAAFLVQAAAASLYPDASALHVALDSALAALLAMGLVRTLPPLERLLLPARAAARRVEAGAESAFCRQGIFRTRARTGLLVYLSLREQRAVLLPDDGVVQALPAEALASLRAQAAGLFREKEPAKALLALLDLVRRACARHLPRAQDDLNELPDAPVVHP
jgi:putative membrane protein